MEHISKILVGLGVFKGALAADRLMSEEEEGDLRTITNTPPAHYSLKIQGFSLLTKHNAEEHTTAEFKAGGYKWKLILYPNGKNSRNGYDNISVYIMLAESSLPHLWSQVHAVFKVFLLDQINGNYYTLQVSNARCFDKMKLEYGFDEFMPLKKFNDPSNGYLVNDTCVFGVEIYVCKENNTCKGERLVMEKFVNNYRYTWEIKSFSSIATKNVHDSMSFYAGGQKWKIMLYPNGCVTGKGSHVSIFLALADPNATRAYAEYTIRIIDQLNAKNHSYKGNNWFTEPYPASASGWHRFISLTDFNASSKGFLVKDKCIIQAEVIVHGVTTPL